MSRYVKSWDELFKSRGTGVSIKTAILEREISGGPLSWHLTKAQIEEIKEDFPDAPSGTPVASLAVDAPVRKGNPSLPERWAWINAFLEGKFDAPVK